MDITKIVKAIKAEQERRLMTQSELARLAGISRQRVSAVMVGRSKSWVTIRIMRDALGLGSVDAAS